jgi:hypothetical protein
MDARGLTAPDPAAPANTRSPVGTNLADVSPFNNNYAFINAFKNAGEWQGYGGDEPPLARRQLDTRGWVKFLKPGQSLYTQLFNDTNGTYPAGEYLLLYDGAGTLTIGGDATPTGAPTRTGNTTRQLITVNPARDDPATPDDNEDAGIFLGLDQTEPSNYLRRVRILMPGGGCSASLTTFATDPADCMGAGSYLPFEKLYRTRTFHPRYLHNLSAYSTLRFMGMMRTNGSTQGEWKDRPRAGDATWATRKGVPLRVLIRLANSLNADAWFNMPHAATDAYVRNFATQVKAALNPGRRVYVEYSNEMWLDRRGRYQDPPNPESSQFDYAVSRGAPLVSAHECLRANAVAGTRGTGCKVLRQQRHQVKRSLEIFGIWKRNFGTVTRVLASTTLDTRISAAGNVNTNELLKAQRAFSKIDVLAIAPYFGDFIYGPDIRDFIRDNYARPRDLDGYFSRLNGELLDQAGTDLRAQRAIIKRFNARLPPSKKIALVAYEGGQILSVENETFFDPEVSDFFTTVNRDPRMKQVYLDYLNQWRESGGQLYNHFFNAGLWSEGQSYGAVESLSDNRQEAPKYDGILTFIERNPRWW